MNKILKIYCDRSDTDVVELGRLVQHPKQLVPKRTLGQDLQHLRTYAMRGRKHGNGYLISKAHFLPNSNLHDIVISFDGEDRTKMMVAIDDKIVIELDIKDKLQGITELCLDDGQYLNDGLVVKFKWNLSRRTKHFRFYTTHKTVTKISHNNSENGELGFNEEEFELESYACRLYVYATE